MVAGIPNLEATQQAPVIQLKNDDNLQNDKSFSDLLNKKEIPQDKPKHEEAKPTENINEPPNNEAPKNEVVENQRSENSDQNNEENTKDIKKNGNEDAEKSIDGNKNDTDTEDKKPDSKNDKKIDPKIQEPLQKALSLNQNLTQDAKETLLDTKNKIEEKVDKSLSDVKEIADDKNLNLKKVEVSNGLNSLKLDAKDIKSSSELNQNEKDLKDKLQAKAAVASNLIEELKKEKEENNLPKSPEDIKKEQLLVDLLNKYDASKNTQRQEANKLNKIEYKIGDGDKAMVIARGSELPKNITDPKIRNEQIEKDFLKELNDILEYKLDTKDIKKVAAPLVQSTKNEVDSKVQDLQNIKSQIQEAPLSIGDISTKNDEENKDDKAPPSTSIEKKEKGEKSDDKLVQNTQTTKQEVSYKNAIARESIKNFASNFKEQLENYKPPITKINIELNPANLGEVTLSISKKGNDLQVNITSNNNVMNLFAQNAVELRNNLMQIGFANLDLNFHSNNKGSNQQTHEDQEKTLQEVENNATNGEVPTQLDITLPNYA